MAEAELTVSRVPLLSDQGNTLGTEKTNQESPRRDQERTEASLSKKLMIKMLKLIVINFIYYLDHELKCGDSIRL